MVAHTSSSSSSTSSIFLRQTLLIVIPYGVRSDVLQHPLLLPLIGAEFHRITIDLLYRYKSLLSDFIKILFADCRYKKDIFLSMYCAARGMKRRLDILQHSLRNASKSVSRRNAEISWKRKAEKNSDLNSNWFFESGCEIDISYLTNRDSFTFLRVYPENDGVLKLE